MVGRKWEGPVDRTVRVVRFYDLKENPLATIVYYACHPIIMAWDNQWFTPDYLGGFETVTSAFSLPLRRKPL